MTNKPTVPAPEIVAEIIVEKLFHDGLQPSIRYIAKQAVIGALSTWRKQIIEADGQAVAQWKRAYEESNAEKEELKTRLFFLERDNKIIK